jgi:beta-glucosidase
VTDDQQTTDYRKASAGTDDRVADLLARMTIEEKAAQLTSVWLHIDPDKGEVAPSNFGGGIFGSPADVDALLAIGVGQITRPLGSQPIDPVGGVNAVNDLQRRLVEHTRLGVPAICHEECLTGLMAKGFTSFSAPLNFAATWEPDLIERVGDTIRRQMRSVGSHQGLAPVADVARDPRWGRVEETLGEDPYLVGLMVSAYVRGLQGAGLHEGIIATLKHFCGYSFSEGGRNFAPTHIGRRELAEVFLLPFEMAVKTAGALSVMNSYQEIDGEAPAASRWLLTDILRGQWGFDGIVVADYGAVSFLHQFHKVTADGVESTAAALHAGLDVELPTPTEFPTGIPAALDRGLLSMDDVDEAVRRVLRLKFRLGLFEQPYTDPEHIRLDTADDRELAHEVAAKSITLLANDGVLPLDPANLTTVAVVGPNADDVMALFGNYSYENHIVSTHFPDAADDLDVPTVLQAIRDRLPRVAVTHAPGCTVMNTGDDEDATIAEAVATAADAEVAIVVVGDKAGHFQIGTVGEGTDTTDLALPGRQEELVLAVAATGTPTIVVLLNGRPFALDAVTAHAGAIVEAWFPGQAGADAVADVLVGATNPGGRTPLSFPHTAGAQPVFYNHKFLSPGFPPERRFGWVFPFGHGLSYTSFTYGEATLVATEVPVDGEVELAITVTNTGDRSGDEVVQLYRRDPVATTTRPVQELTAFTRVSLDAGQSAMVTFRVPCDLFSLIGVDGTRVVEPGLIKLRVGASSGDIRAKAEVQLVGKVRPVGERRALVAQVTVSR